MKVLPVLIVVWSANHFQGAFFLSTLLLAISYFFTPGIAGGCLWYNQCKNLQLAVLLRLEIFYRNQEKRGSGKHEVKTSLRILVLSRIMRKKVCRLRLNEVSRQ